MLLDANVLIYAVDVQNRHHASAVTWLNEILSGDKRVALPWTTVGAFLRISTHPRILERPLTSDEAWGLVSAWLAVDTVFVPNASERTVRILGELVVSAGVTGNLMPDAMLTALAIEHGLAVYSADSDFARFPEVRWVNPLVA